MNPSAVRFLKKYPDKIDEHYFFMNKSKEAVQVIEDMINKKDFSDNLDRLNIYRNPNCVSLIGKIRPIENETFQGLMSICSNPSYDLDIIIEKIIPLLMSSSPLNESIKRIWNFLCLNTSFNFINMRKCFIFSAHADWSNLSSNRSLNAMEYLKHFPSHINWSNLSKNPMAIDILKENKEKIVVQYLFENINAIPLIKSLYSIDEIFDNKNRNILPSLAKNPNAVEIFELWLSQGHSINELSCITKVWLLRNPNALHLFYTWNYEEMKEKNVEFNRELAKWIMDPEWIKRICNRYGCDFINYIQILN